MNILQLGQALEGGILPDVRMNLRKSVVTIAAVVLCVTPLLSLPAAAFNAARVALPGPAGDGFGDGAVPVLIEQQLRDGMLAVDEATALFYRDRAYRPVWTGGERVGALVAAVEAARDHGLQPADFGLDALRREAARPAAEGGPARQAERELRLTDTLARLMRQLRYGKVDPRTLYRTWNFSPPPPADARARTLATVIEAPSLVAAVGAQAPAGDLYWQLQAALQRYRALDALGGWPAVPTGPTLRPGERGARIPALRARLQSEGWLVGPAGGAPDADLYDEALAEAVRRFQQRHGLDADAAVGRLTLAALNTSAAQRVAQMRVNLERLRWLAQDMVGDRLEVDVAAYAARLHLDGRLAWASRAVVGRPSRKTPSLRDSVRHLVFNPQWVVPPTILREDVMPAVARDPAYLVEHRLRVVDRGGQTVDPAEIDWMHPSRNGFPYTLVQDAGAEGSLGRLKFSLGNRYSIYLHDTNAPALFGRPVRAFSSGCVRLERPLELALLLLDDAGRWNAETLEVALATGKTRTVPVRRQIPTLLYYVTAGLDDAGALQLRADIYDHDAQVLAALDAPQRAGAR